MKKSDDVNVELEEMMRAIHKKIVSSSALNGGFEALKSQINNMEDNLSKVTDKVDDVHSALYHPDEGLYARVKKVDSSRMAEYDKLAQQLRGFDDWKREDDQEDEKFDKRIKELEKVIADHTRITSKIKWFMIALFTATISVGVKYTWIFAAAHIHLK